MTTKNFVKLLGTIIVSLAIVGLLAAFVSFVVNLLFFKGTNEVWNYVGIIGILALILPFFLFQFVLPSGILKRYGIQTDIPLWGKVVFYAFVFPFANLLMITVADTAFHFLPNFNEAMRQGYDMVIVQAMREEWMSQAKTILVIAYVSMIGAGLVFRDIFGKRLRAKIS